jgi:hypothetical protein
MRQVFIGLRPPPLLGFCLGWCSNFVGSDLVRNRVLQNMVSDTTQHPEDDLGSKMFCFCPKIRQDWLKFTYHRLKFMHNYHFRKCHHPLYISGKQMQKEILLVS